MGINLYFIYGYCSSEIFMKLIELRIDKSLSDSESEKEVRDERDDIWPGLRFMLRI